MISRRLLSLSLLAASFLVSASLTAATFVVPPDRAMVRNADAIVLASSIASRTVLGEDGGVETITTLSIEEVIKGPLDTQTVEILEPGGTYDDRITIVPGAPKFRDGERHLLFLMRSHRGWHVRDLVLGKFTFMVDMNGRRVAVRDAKEINGWDTRGEVHVERRREAERFVAFVRATAAGGPAREDYFLPAGASDVPLIPSEGETLGAITVNAAASPNTYMFFVSGSLGARWNVFPTAVNFYSVGTEPGAPGNGTTAIQTSFTNWNGDPNSNVNYVLAGSRGSTNGLNGSDGYNAIAFERDLSGRGIPAFQCSGNSYSGTLGIGGVTSASGTHTGPAGETFYTTREGDVEMNRGLANCSLLFNNGDFNTAVAHEVGHTLGFRHSDQGRDQGSACAPPLECSNLAIMKSFIPQGINAVLQAYDRNAVAAVYPGSGGGTTFPPRQTFTFTDDPLVAGVTVIKAVHLAELRSAVNAERSRAGLAAASWTDSAAAGVIVKAVHIQELRARLDEARAVLGLSTGGYTDTITAGTVIRAVHFQEIRNRLK